MALGDITAKLTDIHIDRTTLTVFWTVSRYQEDSDGSLNTLQTVSISQQYPSVPALASQTVLQLYQQGVTLFKSAYPKMPTTIA